MESAMKDTSPTTFPWTREAVAQYVGKLTHVEEPRGGWGTRLVVWLITALVAGMSWSNVDRFGTAIGWLMYKLRIRREVAMTNLEIVYGEKKTAAEKEAIYKASLLNLGRHVLNYLVIPRMGDAFWDKSFEFENEELLRDVYNRGKGVIVVGGHIGIWEIAAGRVGIAGYPISIVAKRLANPVVEKVIVQSRLSMNLGSVPHRDSMQRVMDGLRHGEGIIMAIDQNMKRSQGVIIDWMGRPASTVRSNAWVARETGAPVVAGYAYRVAPGKFKLVITEEIPWETHPDDPDMELLINTRNQAKAVERIIFEKPEIWHWIHRRWKVQAEGVPSPYND